VTEGTGHVIDPDGEARRALFDVVAQHGPGALSDATIMDNLCRNRLAALPGESILIVSAARADVPALLRSKIPELGNYGAIQSVAVTLAQASDLDNAASLWVVREFARTLGMIAPGATQATPRIAPGGPAAEAAGAGAGPGAVPVARHRPEHRPGHWAEHRAGHEPEHEPGLLTRCVPRCQPDVGLRHPAEQDPGQRARP